MTEKQLFTYTNTVIAAELLSNYLDDLKETPVYRQQIKHLSGNLSAELEKMLKIELPKIFDINEMFTINLMREFKSLVENIASSSADDLILYSQVIDKIKENKEAFLDKFEITLTKLDA